MNQITSFNDYQGLAARTAAMDVSKDIRQATFALGFAGEASEVLELYTIDTGRQFATLPKELGDILWYAAALCFENGLMLGEVAGADDITVWHQSCYQNPQDELHLTIEAGKVADYMKKVVGHGHELDLERLASGIKEVLFRVGGLAREHRLSVPDIATANIEKLKARYPDGFSTEASINRKDGHSKIPAC